MRLADQKECEAAGVDPYTALALSRARSDHSREVWRGEELIAEWGWRTDSFLTRSASVWMLSFAPADKYPMFVGRESVRLLSALLEVFDALRCTVHMKHTKAMGWLCWLGFRAEHMYNMGDEVFVVMVVRRAEWEC
jgi:hypothetical protein